jgi:hypothetical protein
MALGWCKACDKLVTIKSRLVRLPLPPFQRWDWYPVEHEDSDGKPCSGAARPL